MFNAAFSKCICRAGNAASNAGRRVSCRTFRTGNILTHREPTKNLQAQQQVVLKARAGSGRTVRLSLLKYNEESDPIHVGWMIRFANENGYLSWCRNSFLLTVVGVTSWASSSNKVPRATQVAVGMFFLAGLNLLTGTAIFFYNIVFLRRMMHMNMPSMALNLTVGCLNVILWSCAIGYYTGFLQLDKVKKLTSFKVRTESGSSSKG